MKRKFLCWALLLVTLFCLAALTSCGGEDEPGDDPGNVSAKIPTTISFYIVTDEATTAKAQKAMQDEFNRVSEQKYGTHVEFKFFTEDEYAAALESKVESVIAARANPGEAGSSAAYVNEYGITYPGLKDTQLDIVLITSREMLTKYVDYPSGTVLTKLNTMLSSSHKQTKASVNSLLMENSKYKDSFYAIPNNHIIGEYTYMLVNKKAADEHYMGTSIFGKLENGTITTVDYSKLAQLIEQVKLKKESAAPGYENMNYVFKPFDYPNVHFWGDSGDAEFIFASFYNKNDSNIGSALTFAPQALAANNSYNSYKKFMTDCEKNGFFTYSADNEDAVLDNNTVVAVLEGGYEIRNQYADDYYIAVLDSPRMPQDEAFSSMFAISSYSVDAARCMEIISDLTCGKTNLRNILQYGVEGEHYTLNSDNTVTRLGNSYLMNINYTGNVFKAYPCASDGMTADSWTYGEAQNKDILVDACDGIDNAVAWADIRTAMESFRYLYQLRLIAPNYGVSVGDRIADYLISPDTLYATIEAVIQSSDASDDEKEEKLRQLAADKTACIAAAKAECDAYYAAVRTSAAEYLTRYNEIINSADSYASLKTACRALADEINSDILFSRDQEMLNASPFGLLCAQIGNDYIRATLAGYIHLWRTDMLK